MVFKMMPRSPVFVALALMFPIGCSTADNGTDPARDASSDAPQDADEAAPDTSVPFDAFKEPECTPGETRDCIGWNGCPVEETCYAGSWSVCFCKQCDVEGLMDSCTWTGEGSYLLSQVGGIRLRTENGELMLQRVEEYHCDGPEGGWYREPASNPTSITLCPSSCDAFEADPTAELIPWMLCPLR